MAEIAKKKVIDNRWFFPVQKNVRNEMQNRSTRHNPATSLIGFGSVPASITKENASHIVRNYTKCLEQIQPLEFEKKEKKEEQTKKVFKDDDDDDDESSDSVLIDFDLDDFLDEKEQTETSSVAVEKDDEFYDLFHEPPASSTLSRKAKIHEAVECVRKRKKVYNATVLHIKKRAKSGMSAPAALSSKCHPLVAKYYADCCSYVQFGQVGLLPQIWREHEGSMPSLETFLCTDAGDLLNHFAQRTRGAVPE